MEKFYQITAAEEWKVCAERQPVKVSQEAVNGPVKSTRRDKPPKSANTSRGHGPPISSKHWVTWACLRGQELLATCWQGPWSDTRVGCQGPFEGLFQHYLEATSVPMQLPNSE